MTRCTLITGGAGYIGSHTAVMLMEAGYRGIIIDNLCNSSPRVLDRLRQLCGDNVLGRHAEHDVTDMCEDAWRWQSMNPTGYAS